MHSPPSSPVELFLSSPHHYLGNGPEDEVETLLASAQKVKELNGQLAAIVEGNKTAFFNVLGRQVQLLKSRSQAFEDAHITVYDKVLLLLTSNGNNLECSAAVTWYCAEYLGINIDGNTDHNAQLIEEAIAIPDIITQGSCPILSGFLQTAKHVQALTPLQTRKNSEASTVINPPKVANPFEHRVSQSDPVFTRLWSVYLKAQSEYLSIADKKDEGTIEAAKFLRDTAENGIHYLKRKYPGDLALAELTKTYNMARAVVLKLNGGVKRKFDDENHTLNEKSRKKRAPSPHTPTRNRVDSRSRKDRQDRRKKPTRGRGPSGIPYGYTRPVDSWYPDREA